MKLPDRVEAILADEGPDGWAIFRLADRRGYTHHEDVIRVGTYVNDGRYHVETWNHNGWHHLLIGGMNAVGDGEPDWSEAVERAVSALYGAQDHS